jgi:hypothetical protein
MWHVDVSYLKGLETSVFEVACRTGEEAARTQGE